MTLQQVELKPAPARLARTGNAMVGTVNILISALCFGSMPIFARFAYATGVDTSTLLLLRFTVAALCIWTIFACRRLAFPRGRGLVLLLVMGAVGYAGQAYCYFTALTLASAGLVSLLLYLYPALVALLVWIVFRQRLTALQVAAVLLALAGSALTIGRAGDGRPLGIALGLLAALIYSGYILAGSRIPAHISPTASTAVITSAAAFVYGGAAAVRGVQLPGTLAGWMAVLAVAMIGTVLAILFFFEGLERVGPALDPGALGEEVVLGECVVFARGVGRRDGV